MHPRAIQYPCEYLSQTWLNINRCLTVALYRNNRISYNGAGCIAKVLAVNNTLKILKVRNIFLYVVRNRIVKSEL